MTKQEKNLKADKKYQEEIDLLEKILKVLEEGKSARTIEFNEDEQVLVKDMFLLTTKPILYVANVSEDQLEDAENDRISKISKRYASTEKAEVIPLCVKIEEELSGLEDDDKKEMLEALGLEESGLDKVIKEVMTCRINVILNCWRTRSKSVDNKKRNQSTTSSRKNTLRHRKRIYKSRSCII